MKKKWIAGALSLVLALGLCACGGSGGSSSSAQTTAAPEQTQAAAESGAESGATADLPELTAGLLEMPVALTSVGQSADVNVVETLFKKAELEVTTNATMTGADLGDCKTLVLAIGGSSKGLGAAGIDENDELERVNALISDAKSKDIKILAVHIGGLARRGTLSDKFIPDAIGAADAAIILKEGDQDNMMHDLLAAAGTPSAYIDTQIDAIAPLQLIFGTE